MIKGFRLNASSKETLLKHIERIDLTAFDYSVDVKPWTSKRSIEQNNLSHEWYEEIAAALPDDDALGWKCYCKLHHGVPILRAEDEEFRSAYDGAIKGLSYEQKREVMKIWPVTSLMKTKQLSAYLEAIKADFEQRQVFLEFPL